MAYGRGLVNFVKFVNVVPFYEVFATGTSHRRELETVLEAMYSVDSSSSSSSSDEDDMDLILLDLIAEPRQTLGPHLCFEDLSN